jgi:hypothetical protein
MSLKRILAALLPLVFLAPGLSAQVEQPGVVVTTQPPGAEVTLDGAAEVTGISPAFFPQGLVGSYKLKVKKYGYESHETEVVLDPTRRIAVDVTLSPKTRLKAAARSIILPGWGQVYAEKKTKGYLFGVLAFGAVGTYLVAEKHFQDRKDDYEQVLHVWDSTAAGGSVDDLRQLKFYLDRAQNRAYDAETVRRGAIGAVIGVWSLAFLDAMFFFPNDRSTFDVKGLAVEPDITPTQVGFALTKRF